MAAHKATSLIMMQSKAGGEHNLKLFKECARTPQGRVKGLCLS
jgi:hypothetical protein